MKGYSFLFFLFILSIGIECLECSSNCTEGEFFFSCVDGCVSCMPGYYCPTTSSSIACGIGKYNPNYGSFQASDCVSCEPGTYSLSTGQSSCTLCEVGYECPGGSTRNQCNDGEYQDSRGKSSCIECPKNHICSSKTSPPVACGVGYFSNAGEYTTCSVCPDGEYTLSKGTSCVSCPSGHFCSSGSITLCTAGTYAGEGSDSCITCDDGYFSPSDGSPLCFECPVGYQCPNKDQPPEPCGKGYYSTGRQMSCSECANGYYTPLLGSSQCFECPAGTKCDKDNDDRTTFPIACSLGEYSDAGDVDCYSCPSGEYCPDPSRHLDCPKGKFALGAAVRTTCTDCDDGAYADSEGSISCTDCPAGSFCPDPTMAPSLCPKGFFSGAKQQYCEMCDYGYYASSEGSSGCTQCPKGMFCEDPASDPIICPEGFVAPALGSTSCTPCTSGYYSSSDRSECIECEVGFSCGDPLLGRVQCSPGTYADSTGMGSCTECPAGSYCEDGINVVVCPSGYSFPGSSECVPCPAGYDCTDPSSIVLCGENEFSDYGVDACTSCPSGYSCSGNTVTSCETGFYSLDGQTNCSICPPGYECPTPDAAPIECTTTEDSAEYSLPGSTSCTPCPSGYFCNVTNAAPLRCVDGTYSLGGRRDCEQCSAGSYCDDIYSASSGSCAAGTFSFDNMPNCLSCPSGYECSSQSDYSSVSICADGFYSLGEQSSCTQCSAGYYCSLPNEDEHICPLGTYSTAGDAECTYCPAGSYCFDPSIIPTACAVGTWSPPGSHECFPCTEGFICNADHTSPNPSGDECAGGTYCASGDTVATNCDAGTYGFGNLYPSGSKEDACTSCLSGYYCLAGSTTPALCPQGYFCPPGTPTINEYPCPAGTYRGTTRGTGISDCIVCPPGSFCLEGVNTPTTCPAGYYCPEGTQQANMFPCPEGTFSAATGNTDYTDCSDCTPGHYCPEQSTAELECPEGTYNPHSRASEISACLLCEPGYVCDSTGLDTYTGTVCPIGYYCPRGTKDGNDYPCPAGTWNSHTYLHRIEDCEICPQGYFCESATSDYTPNICPAGYFCPGAIDNPRYYGEYNGYFTEFSTEFPCLPGTYSVSTHLTDPENCTVCPGGSYCSGGESSISGPCSAGYYCPERTNSPTQFPCPIGTYTTSTSLVDAGSCSDCEPGYYCPEGSPDHIMCPSGSYSNVSNTMYVGPDLDSTSSSCTLCPAGFYCPEGTDQPLGCSEGTYSSEGSSECLECERGSYCLSNTSKDVMYDEYLCEGGTYCGPGMGEIPTVGTYPCPLGNYCPLGTVYPVPCPKGTFNPTLGLNSSEQCTICPSGSFCVKGSSSVSGVCEKGYYCPEGSDGPYAEPCPARTYRNLTGGTSSDDCYTSPPGYYSPIGSILPILCPSGYYCDTGSFEPSLCPIGTYSNTTGLTAEEYCLQCPAGMYCDGYGITEPTGYCDQGYFCISKATTSKPTDKITGNFCPRGGYCDRGSSFPVPCPPGTYLNFTGGKSIDECVECDEGYYCAGSSNVLPTGKCWAGYYCDGGSSVPNQHISGIGSYTPAGSSDEIECEKGTYGNVEGLSECFDCESGYYCEDVGTINMTICPVGHYCPVGSEYAIRCPSGTFNSLTQGQNISSCVDCTPGYYCYGTGRSSESGLCSEGFYCTSGSRESKPIDKSYGSICPEGYYCPSGTSSPFECPKGTFLPSDGGSSSNDCLSCLPGYYCPEIAMNNATTYLCHPGYYCDTGAYNGTHKICSEGYYCPEGSSNEIPCDEGYYSNQTGSSTCSECPVGYYCPPKTIHPKECPYGMYCPAGTGSYQSRCPEGTFRNITLGESVDDCFLCSGGMYCSVQGLKEPNGNCFPGYYCESGAMDNVGNVISGGNAGICPSGCYCPEGSILPSECPTGTYLEKTGAFDLSHCLLCSPAYYCNDTKLDSPVGLCEAGYYCDGGSDSSQQHICPKGSFCPEGSTIPRMCSEGTYQSELGKSTCETCPAGYYCEANCSFPLSCPKGYYCESGTASVTIEIGCPIGTFLNHTGGANVTDCYSCVSGWYCNQKGLSAPSSLCSEGYYCEEGSIDDMGRKSSSDSPSLCTIGHYCPEGSSVPLPCKIGSFSPTTGNVNDSSCISCTPGMYCGEEGLSSPSDYCYGGYYCELGSGSPEPTNGINGNVCPLGHFCENGTVSPVECPEGKFANIAGLKECYACPKGYYCVPGITSPVICPKGEYCEMNTGITLNRKLCPPGSFNNGTGSESINDCLLCDGGKGCSVFGLDEPDLICQNGYYCPQGSKNAKGNLGVLGGTAGGICPKGNYCPHGSDLPSPCPAGSFNPHKGIFSDDQCKLCTPGSYCGGNGLDSVSGLCSGGYYCPPGQSSPTPSSFECWEGYYCEEGSTEPIGCPDGYYQDQTGKTSCVECPEGFYCRSNCSTPVPCEIGYYCPIQSSFPFQCPNGTFGNDTGCASADDCCFDCPISKFCLSGRIIGDCYPGHICYYKNDDPSPIGEYPRGDYCPLGYYCSEGTINPFTCPNGTAGKDTGGRDSSICGPCPAGKYCTVSGGTSVALPCPVGKYCRFNDVPISCDAGTYNPIEGGKNESACLPCRAGYTCPLTGMSDLTGFECPRGDFCPTGSIASMDCPMGTYNNFTCGTSIEESCVICPAGYYCNGTVEPQPCVNGEYCLEGSTEPRECPPKYYCPDRSAPTVCPGGYYCSGKNRQPTVCPEGYYYCPEKSDHPLACPVGYFFDNSSSLRVSLSDVCTICPGGYYGLPDRSGCEKCSDGYVCLSGATTNTPLNITSERGYICPVGHACPAGSSSPQACEKGSYQKSEGQSSCVMCPVDHYNDQAGQSSCQVCGSNSYETEDRQTCQCIGYGRSYQKSDGHCLCLPGWIHYEDNIIQENKDSAIDCSEVVYDRCRGGKVRSALTGECVDGSEFCVDFCSYGNISVPGDIDPGTGMCSCEEVVDENEVCDALCRKNELRLLLDESSSFVIYDPSTKKTLERFPLSSFPGLRTFSSLSTTSSSETDHHRIYSVSVNNREGFKGLFDLTRSDLISILNSTEQSEDELRRSSLLVDEMLDYSNDGFMGIVQPLVCLNYGEGILFHITDPQHYPKYLKDSLLNTNGNFDYGAFRKLENYMKSLNDSSFSTSVDVNFMFHFQFDTDYPGTYIFYDAYDETNIIVIQTMSEETRCPSSFVAGTESKNWVQLGISQNTDIRVSWDSWLVVILFCSFFSFFAVVLIAMHSFVTKDWTEKKERSLLSKIIFFWHRSSIKSLRSKNLIFEKDEERLRKQGLNSFEMRMLYDSKKKEERDENLVDLSDFDVDLFRKHLVRHSDDLMGAFEGYKDEYLKIYNDVMDDCAGIRGILREKYGGNVSGLGDESEELLKKLGRYEEVIDNQMFDFHEDVVDQLITEFEEQLKKFKNMKNEIKESEEDNEDPKKKKKKKKEEKKMEQSRFLGTSGTKEMINKLKGIKIDFENLFEREEIDDEEEEDQLYELNKQLIETVSGCKIPVYWKQIEDELKKNKNMSKNEEKKKEIQFSSKITTILKTLLNETLNDLKQKYKLDEKEKKSGSEDDEDDEDEENDFYKEGKEGGDDGDDDLIEEEEMNEVLELDYSDELENDRIQDLKTKINELYLNEGGEEKMNDLKKRLDLEKEMKDHKKDLKLNHVQELVELDKTLQDEFDEEMEKMDNRLEKVKEMVLESKKKKVRDEIEFGNFSSEEEKERVLEESKKELDAFEKDMEDERAQQLEQVKKMLLEKRKRKKEHLKKKHEDEIRLLNELNQRERKEMDRFWKEKEREREKEKKKKDKKRNVEGVDEEEERKKQKKEFEDFKEFVEFKREEREFRKNEETEKKRQIMDTFLENEEKMEKDLINNFLNEEKVSSKIVKLIESYQEKEIDRLDDEMSNNSSSAKNAVYATHQVEKEKLRNLLVDLKEENERTLEEKLRLRREKKIEEMKLKQSKRQQKELEEKEREMNRLRELLSQGMEKEENEVKRKEIGETVEELEEKLEYRNYLVEKEKEEELNEVLNVGEDKRESVLKDIQKKENEEIKRLKQLFNEKSQQMAREDEEIDENDKKKLISEFEEQRKRIENEFEEERREQMKQIEDVLKRKKEEIEKRAREKKRERKREILELQEQHLNEVFEKSEEKEGEGGEILNELNNELRKGEEERDKEFEKLKEQHDYEKTQLMNELREQKEKEMSFMKQVIENEYLNEEKKIKNQMHVLTKEKLENNDDVDDDDDNLLTNSLREQKDSIMGNFRERKKKLQELEEEQKRKLQEKLQEKMKEKRNQMKKKFQKQIHSLERAQEEQEDEFERERQFAIEKRILLDSIVQKKVKSIEEGISIVLNPRHQKEQERMNKKIEILRKELEKEDGLNEEEREERKMDLKSRMVSLKKRQLREIQECEKECEKYRYLFNENLKKEEEDLKNQLLDYENELNHEKVDLMKEIELEQQKEKERLKREFEEEKMKLLKDQEEMKKQLIREEHDDSYIEEVLEKNKKNGSGANVHVQKKFRDRQNQLMAQYQTDFFNFEELLRKEKERQDRILEDRISEIINQKIQYTIKQQNEQIIDEEDENLKKKKRKRKRISLRETLQKMKKKKELKDKMKKVVNVEHAADELGKGIGLSTEKKDGEKTNEGENEENKGLILTPQEQKLQKKLSLLERIYEKLKSIDYLSSHFGNVPSEKGATSNSQNVTNVSSCIHLEEELDRYELIAYQFTKELIDFIILSIYGSRQKKKHAVHLMVAHQIPFSASMNNTQNFFKESFYYIKKTRTLYVKKEKFRRIGNLVLLVSHCLAHIFVGDGFKDDRDKQFVDSFYQIIVILLNDGFYNRLLRKEIPGKRIGKLESILNLEIPQKKEQGTIMNQLSKLKKIPQNVLLKQKDLMSIVRFETNSESQKKRNSISTTSSQQKKRRRGSIRGGKSGLNKTQTLKGTEVKKLDPEEQLKLVLRRGSLPGNRHNPSKKANQGGKQKKTRKNRRTRLDTVM